MTPSQPPPQGGDAEGRGGQKAPAEGVNIQQIRTYKIQ